MKHYLSFGDGVNSVALYLIMRDMDIEFEAIYVNHGGDAPETQKYLEYFINKGNPITILKPDVEGYSNIYDYYFFKRKVPSKMRRDCTDKFKIRPFYKYVDTPCFCHLGIDYDEQRRARLNSKKGVENHYLLIEMKINRQSCKDIIFYHGYDIPPKSSCFFLYIQKKHEWEDLQKNHPILYKKAVDLENNVIDDRLANNKSKITLRAQKKSISEQFGPPPPMSM